MNDTWFAGFHANNHIHCKLRLDEVNNNLYFYLHFAARKALFINCSNERTRKNYSAFSKKGFSHELKLISDKLSLKFLKCALSWLFSCLHQAHLYRCSHGRSVFFMLMHYVTEIAASRVCCFFGNVRIHGIENWCDFFDILRWCKINKIHWTHKKRNLVMCS